MEPLPLANFGSVTFTDLGLTVPSGSWTLPPYSDAVEMVAPDGSVEALPDPSKARAHRLLSRLLMRHPAR